MAGNAKQDDGSTTAFRALVSGPNGARLVDEVTHEELSLRGGETLTPPEIARQLRVKPEKVNGFIAAGLLRAVNVANPGTVRPRWRIYRADFQEFLDSRSAKPPKPKTARRKRRVPSGVVEFV